MHEWFFVLAASNPLVDGLRVWLLTGKAFTIAQLINYAGAGIFISLAAIRTVLYRTVPAISLAAMFFGLSFNYRSRCKGNQG